MDEIVQLQADPQLILPLVESLDTGFVLVDAAGEFKIWNLASTRILGKGPALEIPPEQWTDHYGLHCPLEHRLLSRDELPLIKALTLRQTIDQEIVIKNDSLSQPRWIKVQARPLFNPEQELIGAIATIRDVTNEKASLLASQMMGWFFSASDDAIVGLNMEGTILLWSPGASKLFGWDSDEIIGRSAYRLVPPSRQKEIDMLLGRARNNQQLPPQEARVIHKAGHEIPILRSITAIRDGQGRITGGVVVARDISELKQTENQLAESREQLRLLSARQQNLLEQQLRATARELHDEFGQQLAAMKFELAWMERHLQGENPCFETRLDSLNRLLDSTISGLRRISRQMRPLLLEDLGLCHAIDELLSEISSRYSMETRFECNVRHLQFCQDASLALFRIVQEALTNAVRHAEATRITVSVQQEEGELRVQIRDNGRGLEPVQTPVQGKFGILGMQERALSWSGGVTVCTHPEGGTLVEARFPPSVLRD